MTKQAKIVIGSSFGDEGKGHIVDYLCSQSEQPGLVVRFSGGAQSGHTVVYDETQHVFSHFGAGTLRGWTTYLSKDFIVNPTLYFKELRELLPKLNGDRPIVYVDPRCRVTTPYDMLVNHIVEEHRGDNKHGSCGIGINETIVRSECPDIYADFRVMDVEDIKPTLNAIRNYYLPKRLYMLGINEISDEYKQIIEDDGILNRFVEEFEEFVDQTDMDHSLIDDPYETIIFEGSQGLLLDQNSPLFPNVTRADTGARKAVELATWFDADYIEIIYVTRPYLTRHGAGRLPGELKELPYPGVKDDTNVHNEHQGHIRYGELDWEVLRLRIRADVRKLAYPVDEVKIAVTCLDQLPEFEKTKLMLNLTDFINNDALITSYGPKAEDVRISYETREM